MTKFIAIICVFFAIAAATSETCDYTENIRALYGFTNTLTAPKTYSDLTYCNSLKGSAVCCTDTQINSIKSISDAYTQNLTTLVSTRDTYLTNVKNNVLPNLLTSIKNFNTAAAQFETTLQKEMAAISSIDLSDLEGSEFDDSELGVSDTEIDINPLEFLSAFGYITNLTTSFVSNVDSIKSNYGNYQTARRDCVLEMIDLQNSAMCLSCDPNAGDKGFYDLVAINEALAEAAMQQVLGMSGQSGETDDSEGSDDSDDSELDESEIEDLEEILGEISTGHITLFYFDISTTVCKRLQGKCNPYLALASGQNQLIEAAAAADIFTGLTSALQSFNSGNLESAMTEIFEVLNKTETAAANVVPALVEAELPEDCNTNGECDWVCQGLFENGVVDPIALLAGGAYGDVFGDDRRLLAHKRRLASSSSTSSSTNNQWAPAEGDSGVAVTFAVDPANTNKKFGSLSLGNVFVGMMVVISSILLF